MGSELDQPIRNQTTKPTTTTDENTTALNPTSLPGETLNPDSNRKDGLIRSESTEVQENSGGPEEAPSSRQYLQGLKLYMVTFGIWVALFLSTLETTIVSTALVSITDSLHGFEIRNWVVTSYLLTYTGFLIIYAKLSDIFGKKTMLILAMVIFTVFSIACGLVNDITSLIILRAFQGMGASGIYSMVLVLAPVLVPREKHGKYVAVISSVFAIASVVGPVLGGVITSKSSWRWVFLLNAPPGVFSITVIAFFLPSETHGFKNGLYSFYTKFSRKSLQRVDGLGTVLLLVASVLMVFGLEEGGNRYPWHSGAIISSLVISGVCWIAWVLWEVRLERIGSVQEPVFPMRLLKSRILTGMMLLAFMVGFPFVAAVVNIPQRTQAVSGFSAVKAGLTLLPLLLTSPLATAISGILTSPKFGVPPFYLILIGAVLQTLGVGLTVALPNTPVFAREQYGYEVIMGAGFGLSLATVLTLTPLVVDEKDVGVVMGALTQVRVMGGTISLAICSAVLSNHLKVGLASVITPSELHELSKSLSTIHSLAPEQQLAVRTEFAKGYGKQMKLLTGFSAAALLLSALIWERKPRRL